MNNGNHQNKAQRESIDEFCKRLGIRIVNEKGGVEFVPYRGSLKAKQSKPVPVQHKDQQAAIRVPKRST
jgi:hypothetical protein